MGTEIVVNTYKLENYAQKLNKVCMRISSVNSQLQRVYWRVNGDEESLVEAHRLRAVLNANTLLRYRDNLKKCVSYLNETASDFETTEQNITKRSDSIYTAIITQAIAGEAASVSNSTEHSEDSLLAKFINNKIKAEGNVLEGELSSVGQLFGIGTAGSIGGTILHGEAGIKNKSSFKFKDDEGNWDLKSFGLSTTASATGALATGEAKGNIGYLNGKAAGEVLTGGVSGEAKATLYEDGKFNPSLYLGASAEGSVLTGEVEAGFGTDQYGIDAGASGDVLHAEAEAKAGVGYIGKDEDGNAEYGAAAEVSAMASIAEGKVEGGITLFGVDIDVGLKGYAGAVGVEAGASVTTDGATASFSGSALLGAGLSISVDWGDAEWVGDTVDAVGDFASNAVDFAGDVVSGAAYLASNAIDATGEFFDGVGDFLSSNIAWF